MVGKYYIKPQPYIVITRPKISLKEKLKKILRDFRFPILSHLPLKYKNIHYFSKLSEQQISWFKKKRGKHNTLRISHIKNINGKGMLYIMDYGSKSVQTLVIGENGSLYDSY